MSDLRCHNCAEPYIIGETLCTSCFESLVPISITPPTAPTPESLMKAVGDILDQTLTSSAPAPVVRQRHLCDESREDIYGESGCGFVGVFDNNECPVCECMWDPPIIADEEALRAFEARDRSHQSPSPSLSPLRSEPRIDTKLTEGRTQEAAPSAAPLIVERAEPVTLRDADTLKSPAFSTAPPTHTPKQAPPRHSGGPKVGLKIAGVSGHPCPYLQVEGGQRVRWDNQDVSEVTFDVDIITVGSRDIHRAHYPDIDLFAYRKDDQWLSRNIGQFIREGNRYYFEGFSDSGSTCFNSPEQIIDRGKSNRVELKSGDRIFFSDSVVIKFID